MKWKQFLIIAYPKDLAVEESHKNIIYRSYRWLGLRFAYLFYHLRISANAISVGRLFISLVSLYFLSLAIQGNIWLPFIGAFLLFGQNILDYADGVVARASGKTSKLGGILDGIVNSFSRGAILVLFGVFTGSVSVIIVSAFSLFILINFRDEVRVKISNVGIFKVLALLYRVSLSIEAMLFILPLLIAFSNLINWSIVLFSYIIVSFYAGLASLWLLLCLGEKQQ